MSLTDETRAAIAAELAAGASQGSMRKKYRVGAGTVSSIKASLDNGQTGLPELSQPKATGAAAFLPFAREAALVYTKERRLAGLDKFFARIEELLPYQTRPADVRQLMVAYAIGIDKARLEHGESSSIEELLIDDARADADPAEELRGRIVSLASRRDANGATG